MANVNVFESHLTYGGVKYFRGKAESIMIGDQGDKQTPLFGANYLSVQDHLPVKKIKIKQAVITKIDLQRSKKADITANLTVADWGGSLSDAYEAIANNELELVKFEMTLGELRDAYNNSVKARRRLDDYGNDGRVANEIFVVMSASSARTFSASRDIGVSLIGQEISLSAGTSRASTVTISASTTYAYLLAKPDWDGRGDGRRIKSFKDDQWALN